MKQFFAFLIAATLAIPAAHAQTADCATPGTDNNFLGIQTIKLWPGTPPGDKTPGVQTSPKPEANRAPTSPRSPSSARAREPATARPSSSFPVAHTCISPPTLKAAKLPIGSPPAASTPSSSATASAPAAIYFPSRSSTPAAPSRPSAPAPRIITSIPIASL